MNTYTVLDNDKIIATKINSRQVSKLTGLDSRAVTNYSYNGYAYKGRYKVVKDGETGYKGNQKLDMDMVKKWNNMMRAAELIRTGKGHIVTKRKNGKIFRYVEEIK
jgi:hypothetical protein